MGKGQAGGPKAPKDPAEKRPAVYVMLNDMLEGRPKENGSYEEICYLEGRVKAKITAIMPEMPEKIAAALQTCAGLREYVHSIGVSAEAQEKEDLTEQLRFYLHCRTADSYDGTTYSAEVPCNGQEVMIELFDAPVSESDTELASFRMEFPKYMTAKMTICFYLKDGYKVPELIPDPPVDFDSQAYCQMIQASLLQEGNLYRLKKAIAKARRGGDVTIAYIGGSITQGAGAKPIGTESYAYRSYMAFRNRFGAGNGENVHFVKAGVGGTPSELGLNRYERDVLRGGTVSPDVVVIEFAVNDAGDETNGVCYESLALMAAKGPGNPAVILLFAVFMDDGNLQERLAPVGEHYDFPMVSVKDAIVPQFYQEPRVLTKRQYFYDLYHPSNTGHRIMADCLDYLWERADASELMGGETDYEKAPLIGNTYQCLKSFTRADAGAHEAVLEIKEGAFSDRDRELQYVEFDDHAYATPEFPDNWMNTGGAGAESFQMAIACKDLMLIYKDSGDHKFGRVQVLMDGKHARTVDPLEVGWNHCNAVIIGNGDEVCNHQVEIRMLPEDAGKCFTILGFGYTL